MRCEVQRKGGLMLSGNCIAQLTSTWQAPLEDANNNCVCSRSVLVSGVLLFYRGIY